MKHSSVFDVNPVNRFTYIRYCINNAFDDTVNYDKVPEYRTLIEKVSQHRHSPVVDVITLFSEEI